MLLIFSQSLKVYIVVSFSGDVLKFLKNSSLTEFNHRD